MSAYDWLITAVGAILEAIAVRRLPAVWRNEHGFDPDVPPTAWPYDLPTWRALVRTYPAGVGFMAFGIPAYVLSTSTSPVGVALFYATSLAGTAFLGLAAPVAVANRPTWLVVPHLRHQPGLIAEWRGTPCAETPRPRNAQLDASASEAVVFGVLTYAWSRWVT